MDYQVLSRRYRPKLFDEVIGQESIVKILKNALASKKIPHAFLFTGIRGTGKTTTARILARALNCQKGVVIDPCNECEACCQLLEGRNMDVFEIDGASNTSVNDVRMIKENTHFLPSQSRYKIYIVDEVHMLSTEAFNALLKTLEEPPNYVVFILATTEPQKIPETVISRCVRLNFRRVEPKEIVNYLAKVLSEENISYEESALFMIARQSDGSVRDALSFLELVLAYGDGKLLEKDVVQTLGLLSREKIFDVLRSMANKDVSSMIAIINQIRDEGGDLFTFIENIIFYVRHLVLFSLGIKFDSKEFSEIERKELVDISENFSKEELTVYYHGLRQILEQIRFSPYPQYDVEVGIIKLILLKDFLENSPTFPTSVKKTNLSVIQRNQDTANIERPRQNEKREDKDARLLASGGTKNIENFVNFLRTKKPLLASQLEIAMLSMDDTTFSVTYFPEQQVFYEHLTHEDEKQEMIAILKEYFGKDVKLKVDLQKDVGENNRIHANNSTKDVVLQHPAVNLLLEEFVGAKILSVKGIEKVEKDTEKEFEELEEIEEKGEDDE